MSGIYQQAGTRSWDKPAVYKINPKGGMWWAAYRDQHGTFHADMFHSHGDALTQALRYAAGQQ